MRVPLIAASLLALACSTAPAIPAKTAGPPSIGKGRPAFEGQPGGIWIWTDAEGWHLRANTASQLAVFTGVIGPINGKIESFRPLPTNPASGQARLTDKGIEFRLATQTDVVGFDWTVTSGCNRFDLAVEGESTLELVRLGAMGEAPGQIPFERCR